MKNTLAHRIKSCFKKIFETHRKKKELRNSSTRNLRIFTIASYISSRYQKEYGMRIAEMHLYQLLYLAQRECIIRTDNPLFPELFEAHRLGPIAPMLREHYQYNTFNKKISKADIYEYQDILDYIFKHYAPKDSWKLADIIMKETCWKVARKGANTEKEAPSINTSNIRVDAIRIRKLRAMLESQGVRTT